MAIPAIQNLAMQGLLRSMGVPESNTVLLDICKPLALQAGIPLLVLNKTTLAAQIDECLAGNEQGYVFTMTFPWKIPDETLAKYPLAFYNFHYGLLPQMRGADPVFEAIRQQCTETGITVHKIDNKIDKGAVLLAKVLPLNLHVTHGMLCTQLAYLGAQMLPEVLTLLATGAKTTPQNEAAARYYKRPGAAEVCIKWDTQDAAAIEALTRACNPWNRGVYTQWNGWHIRIIEATVLADGRAYNEVPGTVISADEHEGLTVQCSNNTRLKLDFMYTDEGYMSARNIMALGLKKGERLTSIN